MPVPEPIVPWGCFLVLPSDLSTRYRDATQVLVLSAGRNYYEGWVYPGMTVYEWMHLPIGARNCYQPSPMFELPIARVVLDNLDTFRRGAYYECVYRLSRDSEGRILVYDVFSRSPFYVGIDCWRHYMSSASAWWEISFVGDYGEEHHLWSTCMPPSFDYFFECRMNLSLNAVLYERNLLDWYFGVYNFALEHVWWDEDTTELDDEL